MQLRWMDEQKLINWLCLCVDLAVGAPFEGHGAVYIFLGGSNGLSTKPSQRLLSPKFNGVGSTPAAPAMFGHGLSKGCDVDSNTFPGKNH